MSMRHPKPNVCVASIMTLFRHSRSTTASVLHGLVCGAEAAAAEEEHGEEGDDPEGESHVEIISHSPDHILTVGLDHRAAADGVVLGEEEGSDDDRKDELAHAGGKSADDRAESPSVSPGADEHEDGVKTNKTVGEAHEASDEGKVGSGGLAVDVAILDQINVVREEISVKILISPVHASTNADVSGVLARLGVGVTSLLS